MHISAAEIDWRYGLANSPRLIVDVDALPTRLRYFKRQDKRSGAWIYYAASYDGYVHFLSYCGPDRGYGGATVELEIIDGTTETLIGPWSGNSLAANAVGFGPCTECLWRTPDGCLAPRAITVSKAKALCASLGAYLVADDLGCLVPSVHPFELHRPPEPHEESPRSESSPVLAMQTRVRP